MSIGALLQAFGVKLSQADIDNAAAAAKAMPALIESTVERVAEIEKRVFEMHSMICDLHRGIAAADAVESEFHRQLVLFPPDQTMMDAATRLYERKNDGERGTNSSGESRDASAA